ncbi:MAG: addiction module toxin, RelE/StbE family [Methanobacterium sp. Maddingley MBC34]|nr:MAG: addiction module toxin, RelE/StbE family [Methanobacterium sp. Maddingley MBC34]
MYNIEITPEVASKLKKLKKRDMKSFHNVISKIKQIAIVVETNPDHCKNLKKPLSDFKRVHVNKGYVLIFLINKRSKIMVVVDYDHHDNIYDKNYRTFK